MPAFEVGFNFRASSGAEKVYEAHVTGNAESFYPSSRIFNEIGVNAGWEGAGLLQIDYSGQDRRLNGINYVGNGSATRAFRIDVTGAQVYLNVAFGSTNQTRQWYAIYDGQGGPERARGSDLYITASGGRCYALDNVERTYADWIAATDGGFTLDQAFTFNNYIWVVCGDETNAGAGVTAIQHIGVRTY